MSLCTPAELKTGELGGTDLYTQVVKVKTELSCGYKAGVMKGNEGDFALAFNSLANLTNEPKETAKFENRKKKSGMSRGTGGAMLVFSVSKILSARPGSLFNARVCLVYS